MRICQVVFEFPAAGDHPIVSGEIKNPYYLSRFLQQRGHDVVVISSPAITHSRPRTGFEVQSDGIPTYRLRDGMLKGVLRYGTRSFRGLAGLIMKLHRQNAFDVIHLHSPSLALSLMAMRRLGKMSAPLVVTAHGTYVPELQALISGKKWFQDRVVAADSWAMYQLDKIVFKHVDRVVSVSEFQVNELMQIYKLNRDKIEVIRNGVDVSHYRPNTEHGEILRSQLGVRTKYLVLFVGRLVRKKGLSYLFKAAKIVEENVGNTTFLVIGGTNEFALHGDEIRREVQKHGVKNVIFKMAVPENELPYHYNAADVCVTPSIDYESIPTVIYEAMSCGKPIVATNEWGIKEIQADPRQLAREKDSKDLAAKISELLTNSAGRREISETNRRYASKSFTWKFATIQHEQMYEEVMS